jgi:hypothetical protein
MASPPEPFGRKKNFGKSLTDFTTGGYLRRNDWGKWGIFKVIIWAKGAATSDLDDIMGSSQVIPSHLGDIFFLEKV